MDDDRYRFVTLNVHPSWEIVGRSNSHWLRLKHTFHKILLFLPRLNLVGLPDRFFWATRSLYFSFPYNYPQISAQGAFQAPKTHFSGFLGGGTCMERTTKIPQFRATGVDSFVGLANLRMPFVRKFWRGRTVWALWPQKTAESTMTENDNVTKF